MKEMDVRYIYNKNLSWPLAIYVFALMQQHEKRVKAPIFISQVSTEKLSYIVVVEGEDFLTPYKIKQKKRTQKGSFFHSCTSTVYMLHMFPVSFPYFLRI